MLVNIRITEEEEDSDSDSVVKKDTNKRETQNAEKEKRKSIQTFLNSTKHNTTKQKKRALNLKLYHRYATIPKSQKSSLC